MRILLTAFEPFDGTGLNASLEGCRLFLERWGSEFDLRLAVLPVEYGRDTEAVDEALAGYPAEILLHTGQASRAAAIEVERLAVNVRYASSDMPLPEEPQELIDPSGPAALFATLPVEAVAAGIRAEGVPAIVSNHAGIYLCNHVLYQSLRRAERGAGPDRVGFIHVPRLPEQVALEPGRGSPAGMPAEAVARALRAALRCAAS